MFYQVIIIGAGPSGLSAALELYENGIRDVLVLERGIFPRYKCCAGYITAKTKAAYKRAGLDIDKCRYSLIKDFNIIYKYKTRLTIENKFLYTNEKIDRVELDDAFFRLAVQKGVKVAEGAKITGHNPEGKEISVEGLGVLNYEYLIFADGTTGYGSKYQKCGKRNVAMQLTFASDRPEQIGIYFGITKRGYAWVSSYGGTTNVGVTDVYNPKTNYKEVFSKFMKDLNLSADESGLKGAFTPIGVKKPIVDGNMLFVGDAVGACDPLTLSGLRYGLKSGEVCANAIARGNLGIYKRYIKNLKMRFAFMKLMQKVFYLKITMFTVFNVGCRFFGGLISRVFNNFFVNKK